MTLQEKRDSIGNEYVEKWKCIKQKCEEVCWRRLKKTIKRFDKGVRSLRKKGWTDSDEIAYQEFIKRRIKE